MKTVSIWWSVLYLLIGVINITAFSYYMSDDSLTFWGYLNLFFAIYFIARFAASMDH